MKKFILTVMSVMSIAGSVWGGCNPCICGSGGGLPFPPDCPDPRKTNYFSQFQNSQLRKHFGFKYYASQNENEFMSFAAIGFSSFR